MKLNDILKEIEVREIVGPKDVEVRALTMDSREVAEGTLFAAIEGTAVDGHRFIGSAVEKGASVVVCNHLPEGVDTQCGVTYVVVEDSSRAIGLIASNFYGRPSEKLALVGVTGTNGKTTTATLLYNLTERLGYKAGLISTVVYRIGSQEEPSTHTTPDAINLNRLLAQMVDAGCGYCFMEVSSHSLVQHRTAGLRFAGALFSNLTHDHLDYHGTFAEYIKAKKLLFDGLDKGAWAVVNADDRNGKVMLQNCRAAHHTYSLRGVGEVNCKILETTVEGMLVEIDGRQMWSQLTGKFNAYNLTAVYMAAVLLGNNKEEVLAALSGLGSVKGRFQTLRSTTGITAIVDYAHTPDALDNVLDTIAALGVAGKVITVCGCGGDRDKTKRPEMAAIAAEKSHTAIFTSDNPRTENPDDILADMESGVVGRNNYLIISDRAQAIRAALRMAGSGDVVLVAGKGHEEYQIIGTEKTHFSDQEQVADYFKKIS
ncbi:MAG: UDP-N-acetylmuramoyl-L-alanyl-D-glutamate--2,6-diaminopimelate ligase [Tidjanibacter sp.]|nr:UDP-N-acetylmuramoyl-L-alanyl-D-glutamate--2,6-diaminopimelate ligase [Tidjanibacter sp.]